MEFTRFFMTSLLVINLMIFYHQLFSQPKQGYYDYLWERFFQLLPNSLRPSQFRDGSWFSNLHDAILRTIDCQPCNNGNIININIIKACIIFTAVCMIFNHIIQILVAISRWRSRDAPRDCNCCDILREMQQIGECDIKAQPTTSVSGKDPSQFGPVRSRCRFYHHRSTERDVDVYNNMYGATGRKTSLKVEPDIDLHHVEQQHGTTMNQANHPDYRSMKHFLNPSNDKCAFLNPDHTLGRMAAFPGISTHEEQGYTRKDKGHVCSSRISSRNSQMDSSKVRSQHRFSCPNVCGVHTKLHWGNQTKPTFKLQTRSLQEPTTQSQKDLRKSQGSVALITMIIQKSLGLVFGLPLLVHESYHRISPKQEKSLPKLIPPGHGFLKRRPSTIPFVDRKALQVLELNVQEKIIQHQWGLPCLIQSSLDIQLPAPRLIRKRSQTKPTGIVIAKTSPLPFIGGETREILEWHINDKFSKLPCVVRDLRESFKPPARQTTEDPNSVTSRSFVGTLCCWLFGWLLMWFSLFLFFLFYFEQSLHQ